MPSFPSHFRWLMILLIAGVFFISPGWGQESLPLIAPQVTAPDSIFNTKKPSKQSEPFHLGFWNIRWFPGHHPVRQDIQSREKQRKAVEVLISGWDPAILFTSEIRDIDALKSLKLNYPYRACTDIPRTEDENPDLPQQGVGLLSRFPWLDIWTLDFSRLPLSDDKPSRGILAVQFELQQDSILTCYAVHLKSNRGGIEATHIQRKRAVDYLRWDWKRKGIHPSKNWIIVLGDFNTSLEDPAFESDETLSYLMSFGFKHGGEGLPRAERLTIHGGRYPANDFDHIFLSSPLAEALGGETRPRVELRKVPGWVSDHDALFLNLSGIFNQGD